MKTKEINSLSETCFRPTTKSSSTYNTCIELPLLNFYMVFIGSIVREGFFYLPLEYSLSTIKIKKGRKAWFRTKVFSSPYPFLAFCKRTASSRSRFASSLETGLAFFFKELQTSFLASSVFALAKGFGCIFSSIICQIYDRLRFFHNSKSLFLPRQLLSLGELFVWGIRSWTQSIEFFFSSCIHRLWYNNPVGDNHLLRTTNAWDFSRLKQSRLGLSRPGSLHSFRLILRNQYQFPSNRTLYLTSNPEEWVFLRRFHFGAIELDPIYDSELKLAKMAFAFQCI